jgi:hypothetical protein
MFDLPYAQRLPLKTDSLSAYSLGDDIVTHSFEPGQKVLVVLG